MINNKINPMYSWCAAFEFLNDGWISLQVAQAVKESKKETIYEQPKVISEDSAEVEEEKEIDELEDEEEKEER